MRIWNPQTRKYTFDSVWEIYALIDPVTKEPAYVGRTTHGRHRLTDHFGEANNRPLLNIRKSLWLMKLRQAGLIPEFKVLAVRKTLAAAKRTELKWIEKFGKFNKIRSGRRNQHGDRTYQY